MTERKLKAADLFCGGGGFTTGAHASGRVEVVLAVNPWRTAIYTHQQNHPETRHICARIDDVDPRNDRTLPELDLLLASPECTHHSIARGGKPIDDQKRATPWHVLVWAEAKRPAWICVENVREFRDWGPLDAKCRPVKARKGEIFQQWIKSLEAIGYQVDCQLLNAADFGAATSRTRLFIVARRGRSRRDIPWPEITHPRGNWKPAWSIIDWSKPCPSIFTRKRPLAEKTLRRIEAGLKKFCGQAFQFKAMGRNPGLTRGIDETVPTIVAARENHALVTPFIVQLHNNMDAAAIGNPLGTITTSGAHHALAFPFLVNYHGGTDPERDGTERAASIDEPVPVIPTENRYGLVAPFIVPHFGERDGQAPRTHDVGEPVPTVTGQGAGSLAVPFILPRQGFYDCHRDKPARSVAEPVPTITANHGPGHVVMPFLLAANHGGDNDRSRSPRDPMAVLTTKNGHSLIMPFLTKFNGTGGCQSVNEPVDTITARDRFGLAMVSLMETMQTLGVVDIGFRMLEPDELSRAQGFPEGYSYHGTRVEQVRQIGNAVCPPVARALCETIAEAC